MAMRVTVCPVAVFQMVKDDYEDESHVFRKAANDITSQLEINFGNLPRPGRGARGSARGGRGRIRRTENYGPRAEVVVSPDGLLCPAAPLPHSAQLQQAAPQILEYVPLCVSTCQSHVDPQL